MQKRKAFSLIELLVVVAIMGLLAGMAVVALNQAREKARNARRVADVKQIQTALELYYMDYNGYPTAPANTVLDTKCISSAGIAAPPCVAPTYMALVPTNPAPLDLNCMNPTNTAYTYAVGTNNTTYQIRWCISQETGGVPLGQRVATPAGLANP